VGNTLHGKYRSLRSLEWLNFFLADVQTGLGPFLAAYLASNGWHPDRVGFALTFGGLVAVALQTPAGAAIDAVHRKRTLLAVCLGVLVAAAFLLMGNLSALSVYSAQFLIGGAGTFLAPTVAAITLGIVGAGAFDRQLIPPAMYLPPCWSRTSATSLGIAPSSWFRRCWLFPRPRPSLPSIQSKSTTPGREEQSKKKARRGDCPHSSGTVFFFPSWRALFFFI
jgi:MFS family permease